MYLLDIIIDPSRRHPVRPVRTLPDTIVNTPDTGKVPTEIPDTVVANPEQVPDTAKAVMDWIGINGDSNTSMLLWGILVVVAALVLCLWLARIYRRRLAITR